jgi:hypothetical protein
VVQRVAPSASVNRTEKAIAEPRAKGRSIVAATVFCEKVDGNDVGLRRA